VREPTWIEIRDVLALHSRLVTLDGGAIGLPDEGLLRSALARPRHLYAYGEKPDLAAMAAAYIGGIVGNPFVDGNKRTGFVVGVLFLEMGATS
jgi:death-on-curing protein